MTTQQRLEGPAVPALGALDQFRVGEVRQSGTTEPRHCADSLAARHRGTGPRDRCPVAAWRRPPISHPRIVPHDAVIQLTDSRREESS